MQVPNWLSPHPQNSRKRQVSRIAMKQMQVPNWLSPHPHKPRLDQEYWKNV